MVAQHPDNPRNRELAQIHIAKAQLGLDDETYRQMLWAVARVRSAADLDFAGRKAVLGHLKSRGFKARPGRRSRADRPLADDPLSKKIRALWIELHQQGRVHDPSEAALAAFVKRQTGGVGALQWLTPAQAGAVIEALKKWLQRSVKHAG